MLYFLRGFLNETTSKGSQGKKTEYSLLNFVQLPQILMFELSLELLTFPIANPSITIEVVSRKLR